MLPTILVVDDDAENCGTLSELLAVEGFGLRPVGDTSSGRHAVIPPAFRLEQIMVN
jgi:CheY-like chemotaxis protein